MTQEDALAVLKSGVNVFLTGEPGSGKTHTVNLFSKYLYENYKRVAVTASTGIAATHINGKTIHSWCGLGIKEKVSQSDIDYIMSKGYAVSAMVAADVLVIDEISMLSAQVLDNVDTILRHVRGSFDHAFGGLQVVFVGDFFQLPPVNKKGTAKFAFESDAWRDAAPRVCYLTEQHRQSDGEFLEILTAMRNGMLEKKHISRLKQKNKVASDTRLFTHNTLAGLSLEGMNEHALLMHPKIVEQDKLFRSQSELPL